MQSEGWMMLVKSKEEREKEEKKERERRKVEKEEEEKQGTVGADGSHKQQHKRSTNRALTWHIYVDDIVHMHCPFLCSFLLFFFSTKNEPSAMG